MSAMRKTNRKARCALKRHAVLLITCGIATNLRFSHAADFFKAMAQARVDNSAGPYLPVLLSPELLILDDLGLHRLTAQPFAVYTL